MIRLTGLVDLKALVEAEEPEEPKKKEAPEAPEAGDSSDKSLTLKKLLKLKTMDLSPEQEKKVDEMLSTLHETMDEEFKAKDIPAGTSWKLAGTGWAAKNRQGKTNYWYGKDANKNKEAADKWRMNEGEEPTQEPQELDESAPSGWEKTVLAMKKHKEIDNPWALSQWMKKKGYEPTNEVSTATLTSYKTKANADRLSAAKTAVDAYADDDDRPAAEKRITKRSKGIKTATDKINSRRKPGETWTTDSGKKAKKNSDGSITYSEK